MNDDFDFDKALKALQSGKAITGKEGVLAPLIKTCTACVHGRGPGTLMDVLNNGIQPSAQKASGAP